MGCSQYYGTCHACFGRVLPSLSTYAPSVPRLQPGEVELRYGSDEVVSLLPCELEEVFSNQAADCVQACVVAIGVTAAVSEPTGERVGRAGLCLLYTSDAADE